MKDLVVLNGLQGHIEWDADGAKSAIAGVVAPYRGLVVTDDNVKDMEKAQKELASMRRKIDQFRKNTKKKAEEPIKAFEMEVYDILKVIDEAEAPLKDQLHKYEVERVNTASKEVQAEATAEAERQGLREQYMFDFKINSSWTNRTAKRADILSGVVAAITELKARQDLDDERAKLIEANKQQIELLCQTLSDKYSLNTPITPADCPAWLAEKCMPAELVTEVERVVKRAADRELAASQTAAAMAKAEAEATAAMAVPAPTPTAEPSKNGLYTVRLTMRNVPADVVERLKGGHLLLKCEYELEVM
jgi:chemotaxis protein histidine kinase CheA